MSETLTLDLAGIVRESIVDGRFVLAERDLSLRFRGSRNQRILDMKATREAGEPVLADEYM